jgi:hypothetical protein
MKKWFKNNYSVKSIFSRARAFAATMGFIEPIDVLTVKQLRNTVR